jgi:hypothetical protein
VTPLLWIAAASFGLLLFVWFGYPVYLWICSAFSRAPNQPDHATSVSRRVSVILATRETTDVIAYRVANLFDTDHPSQSIEVVVCLDAAGAGATRDQLAHLDPRVHIVNGDTPGGKAAALNAGVRIATGDVLVMADSRQQFDRRTIPELVAALEDERFGAVSGALTLGGSGSPVHAYWALEKWIRHREAMIHSTIGVTGAVYAMRRALWAPVPEGTLLDDVFIPMSLVIRGHRVGFTYAARATDARAFDSRGEGARKTRTSTGLLQLRTLLPSAFRRKQNPLWLNFLWHKYSRLLTPVFFVGLIVPLSILTIAAVIQATLAVQLGLLITLGVLFAMAPVRRRLLAVGQWFVELNASVIRASINGARNRWHVWHTR